MAANQMDDVIRLVCSEAKRLGEFLSGLNETDWAKASYCEGWVIGDVVGHLAGGAENWINSIDRAVNGDSNPPEGQTFLAPGDRASNVTADSARNAYQQQGTQLLERFKTGYAQLAEVLGGLKPEDWDKQCFHRRGAMPIGGYVEVRLQELTVHSWDIRWGVDPSAQMWEDALGVMVGRVPRWVSNAFQPGLSLPSPVRYRFAVSQPVPVRRGLRGHGGGVQGRDRPAGSRRRNIPLQHGRLHTSNLRTARRRRGGCIRAAVSRGPGRPGRQLYGVVPGLLTSSSAQTRQRPSAAAAAISRLSAENPAPYIPLTGVFT